MKRIVTKIGDLFMTLIAEDKCKYFQYIADDLTQLNSSVIRAFKKEYSIYAQPHFSEIIGDEIDFYAHTILKNGITMNIWKKIGNSITIGKTEHITFRSASDYGRAIDEDPIVISHKWYVWHINEKSIFIGALTEPYKKSFNGLVFNPLGILELLKGNKYPPLYPDFE